MQATALTLGLVGVEAHLVFVEVDAGRGPATFQLVGLAEASVREARVRVRAALLQQGIDIDEHVLTASMSPADLRKGGSSFDVALAVGVLGALGKLDAEALLGTALLGEIALSGRLRGVRGVLPAVLAAQRLGVKRAIVPRENEAEVSAVTGIEALVADSMQDVVSFLQGRSQLERASSHQESLGTTYAGVDLAEVRGQHGARRALEVAASGHHNLVMMGPPGAGKTMLARRLPGLLPPMTPQERLESTAVHSVAGLLPAGAGLLHERAFRAPHHTVSVAALVGGGTPVRPGEVSLAHAGCLFLDELPEFSRVALETLRQPLEDGTVTIARARERAVFPARPLLLASLNPCPCGFFGTPRCQCAQNRVRGYRARISGPLLDRIDLQIMLPPVEYDALSGQSQAGECTADVRARVASAREVQLERQANGEVTAISNAALSAAELQRVAKPDAAGDGMLRAAAEKLGLSARGFGKVLRVARTLADLEGRTAIATAHLAEAIALRALDRR